MEDSSETQNGYRDAAIHVHDLRGVRDTFFNTPERTGLIEQLLHLVQFGEGLPVVVGDAGMGKTTLLAHLSSMLDQVEYCAMVELTGRTRLAQALSALLSAFGVAPKEGAGELLAQVRHFAQQLASEQFKAVLLLDNAHHLDDAALGAIISLLQGNDSPGFGLQLVFSSKPGLVERMDSLQLVDVPVYDFALPPLSSAQLADFLLSEQYVGDKSALLTQSEVTKLWGQSMGNPGLSLLLLAKPKRRHTSGGLSAGWLKGVPLGHIIAMFLLVSVLAWAILVREEPSDERVTEIAVPTIKNIPAKVTPESATPFAEPETVVEPASPPSEPRVSSPTTKAEPAPRITEEQELSQKEISSGVATNPVPAAPTAAPKPSLVPKKPVSPVLSDDERFLVARADSEFTLQVMAASQKSALQSFVMRQPNRKDLYIYQVDRNGRRLFVVLAGIYGSKEDALLARDSLPKEQSDAGPWPRVMLDIKREIAENRR